MPNEMMKNAAFTCIHLSESILAERPFTAMHKLQTFKYGYFCPFFFVEQLNLSRSELHQRFSVGLRSDHLNELKPLYCSSGSMFLVVVLSYWMVYLYPSLLQPPKRFSSRIFMWSSSHLPINSHFFFFFFTCPCC